MTQPNLAAIVPGTTADAADINQIITPLSYGFGNAVYVAASNASAKAKAQATYLCDGVNDDVEINAALLSVQGTDGLGPDPAVPTLPGGQVILSEGLFTIGAPLVQYSRSALIGSGMGTMVRAKNSFNANMHTLATITTEFVLVADLQFDGNKGNQTSGNGIYWDQTGSSFSFSYSDTLHVLRNVLISNCKNDALKVIAVRGCQFDHVVTRKNDGNGFVIQGSDMFVSDCDSGHNGLAGYTIGPSAGFQHFTNCLGWGNGLITPAAGIGFKTISTFGSFIGCLAQDNSAGGFSIEWGPGTNLVGCMAESNGDHTGTRGYGFHLAAGSDHTTLEGCYAGDSGSGSLVDQDFGLVIDATVDYVRATGGVFNNFTSAVVNNSTGTHIDVLGFLGTLVSTKYFRPTVTVYSVGSATWTKPTEATFHDWTLVAGGGGGGSGRRGAASSARGGGGGGGGGGHSRALFRATDLGTTANITVGAGGAGGAVVSADSTDGNAGSIGGATYLGAANSSAQLSAQPGGGGAGGTASATAAGGFAGRGMIPGSGGGTGSANSAGGLASAATTPGGGGGGGVDTVDGTFAGAAGKNSDAIGGITVPAGGTAGAGAGDGGAGGTAAANVPPITGTGAAGGGSSNGGNGGIGGAGKGGGGGGGGGASANTVAKTSGAGGVGGDGFAVVASW